MIVIPKSTKLNVAYLLKRQNKQRFSVHHPVLIVVSHSREALRRCRICWRKAQTSLWGMCKDPLPFINQGPVIHFSTVPKAISTCIDKRNCHFVIIIPSIYYFKASYYAVRDFIFPIHTHNFMGKCNACTFKPPFFFFFFSKCRPDEAIDWLVYCAHVTFTCPFLGQWAILTVKPCKKSSKLLMFEQELFAYFSLPFARPPWPGQSGVEEPLWRERLSLRRSRRWRGKNGGDRAGW